jgi:hypothetical protein
VNWGGADYFKKVAVLTLAPLLSAVHVQEVTFKAHQRPF